MGIKSKIQNPKSKMESRPRREDFLPKEWEIIRKHRTPRQVQGFLRALPYNWEKKGETLRTFRGVVQHWSAHCLEAALTAATILEQHGYPPLLLDLESKDRLDHVLFLFRRRGLYGTVARSRDFGLHGRKPVFRTLRHLVMSYDLRTLERCDWRLSPGNVWSVERALIRMPHQKLRTSDGRHRRILRQFRAFKQSYPDRPVDFYRNQHRWM
ncbi:MAG: hypothetical protein DMG26_15565 [Acidobacteria bacterium]|nr:MAG: hypothetical protein DMG26_15565 [Acidobacteriota bacterium]